jgi:hypothetical protein
MLTERQLELAVSALAEAAITSVKNDACDIADEQMDTAKALIRDNRYEEPQIVSRLFQEALA